MHAGVAVNEAGLGVQPNVNQTTLAYYVAAKATIGNSIHSPSNKWILDSGATDHITCSTLFYSSCYLVVGIFVQLPTKSLVKVTNKGIIQLNSEIILKDVLCVLEFTFNIVSQTKLTLHNFCIVISDHSTCLI